MKKKSKPELAAEWIRNEISENGWGEGQYIKEKELCERLSISKVSIRTCLQKLQEEGVLKSVPYRGYILGPEAYRLMQKDQSGIRKKILYVEHPGQNQESRPLHEDTIYSAVLEECEKNGLELVVTKRVGPELVEEVLAMKETLLGISIVNSLAGTVDSFMQWGIPIVTVEFLREGWPIDGIVQDDRGGVEIITDYLVKKGHTEIGLIVWSKGFHQPLFRRAGFAESMMKRNLLKKDATVTVSEFNDEGGREGVEKLYANGRKPSAIIVSHLEMLRGVLYTLKEKGIKVGKDVTLILWGSKSMQKLFLKGTEWENMEFDYVEWSREEMGSMVVKMIMARDYDRFIPTMRVMLPVHLKTVT